MTARPGSAGEVFVAFLRLGLTSFGGPVAHLGFFREAFVARRKWLSEEAYAELLALCQLLPGPASSQVGFALGWMRAGYGGALAAWTAFTLPSVVLLIGFALWAEHWTGPLAGSLRDGLTLVPVAIVAHAVWTMATRLSADVPRALVSLSAFALIVLTGSPWLQVAAILGGGLAGWAGVIRVSTDTGGHWSAMPDRRGLARGALIVFAGLLVGLPVAAMVFPLQALLLVDGMYRAGALVFGGGHVVLPLLERVSVAPGWVTPEAFLSGYGAAQAVPGPLFSFGAYLGFVSDASPGGLAGAGLALAAVFLPGLLLVLGVLPHWARLRQVSGLGRAVAGANAAVVGVLAAALVDPVIVKGIGGPGDALIAGAGLALLIGGRASALIVVGLTVAASMTLDLI